MLLPAAAATACFNVLKFKRLLVVVRRYNQLILIYTFIHTHTHEKTYWRQCSWLCQMLGNGLFTIFFPRLFPLFLLYIHTYYVCIYNLFLFFLGIFICYLPHFSNIFFFFFVTVIVNFPFHSRAIWKSAVFLCKSLQNYFCHFLASFMIYKVCISVYT